MGDIVSNGPTPAQLAGFTHQQEVQQQLADLQQNGFYTMPEPMRSRAAKNVRGFFTEISSPFHFTMQQLANVYSLSSLRTLCKYNALQHIPASGSISVEELASKTQISTGLLQRLLRLLFVTEFLRQDGEGKVAHTRLSSYFAQSPEMQAMLDVLSEHTFLSLGRLPDYFEARGEASEPDDQSLNPYTWSRGKDGTSVWKVMEENGELARFQAGLNPSNKHVPPTGYFDFGALVEGELGDRDVLVDVGGGIGMVLKTIIEATPALQQRASKCVVQDLAGPIEEAKASGHLPEGVRAMAHSFFDEQQIKGISCPFHISPATPDFVSSLSLI